METIYEWSKEYQDEHGDIVECEFADRLKDLPEGGYLVLLRRVGDEIDGEEGRDYAYVKDGKLPEFFEDTDYRVPQRFHKELACL